MNTRKAQEMIHDIKHSKRCTCPKENKPQHTPTPWTVFGFSSVETVKKYRGDRLEICEAFTSQIDSAEAKANAAFIVRAVNSHEELLGMAKAWVEIMDADPTTPKDILVKAKQAIAKAEQR